VVIVLNNGGYGTERHIKDGAYNDLLRWNYHRLPEIFGAGVGFLVRTEEDLDEALKTAGEYRDGFCLLEVILDPQDHSAALGRLGASLARRL